MTAEPEYVPESREDWRYLIREGVHNFWDGTKVPSYSQLAAWEFGEFPDLPHIQTAAQRGKFVHMMTELYDRDQFDTRDLDEPEALEHQLAGYLTAWAGFLDERGNPKFQHIEKAMHGIAGGVLYLVRPDRVLVERRVNIIWDIKSKGKSFRGATKLKDQDKRRYSLELAAQCIAVAGTPSLAKKAEYHAECVFLFPKHAKDGTVTWTHEISNFWLPDAVDDFVDLCERWATAVGYDPSWRNL